MNILFLFSLFDLNDLWPGPDPVSPAIREYLVLFGAVFLVVILVTAGLLLRRELKHRRSERHSHSRRRRSSHRTGAGVAELKKMIHKKPRPHHEHRPRNPTLAEAGGLPPVRSDDPLNPPQTGTQSP